MNARSPGYEEVVIWLTVKVADYLGLRPDDIDIDIPLADCGIDSMSGMALCADMKLEKGFDVDTTIVWDYATIGEIAAYLTGPRGAA